ncbi:hypothetical protein HMPREF1051_1950 [Neisseria sicca VK64]|uniref:Uncharacterized protein n=1 Tax=Neisseria sicca VK64 TaxID=1095748 RepID=I2NTZ7_NEISI|nr:hypothetical protein HMPREF1051_1950 [Neisseria sicca VK64]
MNTPCFVACSLCCPPSKRSSENLFSSFQTTCCLIKSLQLLPDRNQQ